MPNLKTFVFPSGGNYTSKAPYEDTARKLDSYANEI